MIKSAKIELLASDLDGTLLDDLKMISTDDYASLERLGKLGIVRVAATGRSLFKVKEVLPADVPLDYVLFSSGGGVYDWKNNKILHSEHFGKAVIDELCKHLLSADYNFFVYRPIPDNNLFWYHQGAGYCSEYEDYMRRHAGDYQAFDVNNFPGEAGQLMAIIPNDDALFESLKHEIYAACSGVKVIRATSPVNPEYTWLEIFPDTVSKGHGLAWLCSQLGISQEGTLGIGNDFNDLDMFGFVAHGYLLNNGAEALKKEIKTVSATNNESGVSRVLELFGL